jgi:divalent metal cation (Fe/Co/Zn/Cd) transporter
MNSLSKEQATRREKTLLIALLLSAPGPLVTGYAVLTSHSTTQFADFLRRGVELVALFVSWWVFRQLQQKRTADQARLERLAGLSVAGTMLFSGTAMLIVALSRLSVYEPSGRVALGLLIAILGLLTNGWFWWRYTVLTREQFSAVIAAQQGLYRAKASVDFCVVTALAAVAIAPTHPATRYVDILGSVMVAVYLLWNGLNTARSHLGPLRTWFHAWREHPGQIFSAQIEKEHD